MSADVIIVGGGVYGASIAYHLAVSGVRTALFERGALASGPTGRSSANVRLHYTIPELADLARRGVEIFEHFTELTGGDAGFRRIGVAYAIGADEAPRFEESVGGLRTRGFAIETKTPAELLEIVPGFDLDGVALGVWEPTTGYADPVGTTVGFAYRARELGAELHLGTRVERLLVEGGRAVGIETADGRRHASATVIVAAGPWTSRLISPLGVHLPLHVERQAITIFDAPGAASGTVPCVWGDFVAGFYARPEGESSILLGDERAPAPLPDPDVFSEQASLAESADIASRAVPRIPAMVGLGIRRGYASLYDVSADRLHIIDWVPGVDGLMVVCGTSGHGFKLAPAMGEEIARLATDGSAPLLAPFRLDRVYDVDRERSR